MDRSEMCIFCHAFCFLLSAHVRRLVACLFSDSHEVLLSYMDVDIC